MFWVLINFLEIFYIYYPYGGLVVNTFTHQIYLKL